MTFGRIVGDTYFIAGNASLITANTNLLMKGGVFSYGLVTAGASLIDRYTITIYTSKMFMWSMMCLLQSWNYIFIFPLNPNKSQKLRIAEKKKRVKVAKIDNSILFQKLVTKWQEI
jgi:hypothetical protein